MTNVSFYKKFMRHVKNVTKNAPSTKPFFKYVKHYEDGSLAVTDGHRLYYVKDIHDKGDCLLTIDGKRAEGEYPEFNTIAKIINTSDSVFETVVKTKEWLKAADLVSAAAKLDGYGGDTNSNAPIKNAPIKWVYDSLRFKGTNVNAYVLVDKTAYDITLNAHYLLHAIKTINLFKYESFKISISGTYKPLVLSSLDDRFKAAILPIRTY